MKTEPLLTARPKPPIFRENSASGAGLIGPDPNMRYMDAYVGSKNNTAATRKWHNNDAQIWIITPLGNDFYTMRQKFSTMYLDAYEGSNDNDVVTRHNKGTHAQQWIIKKIGHKLYTIQQRSSGRFLDAYVNGQNDHLIVTRDAQNNATQQWVIRLAQ